MFLSCFLFCDDHRMVGADGGNFGDGPDGGSGAV